MDVQAKGRQVSVSASTLIREQRANCNFVWALRAFDLQRKLVAMTVYDKNVFAMPPGIIDMWPLVNESIKLPVGSYHVELVLYIIPPGFDASRLKADGALEAKYRQAFASKPVTITD
jgi:hypothetical protein